MSNRFVDNVTPLNAATLNKFEEDLTNMLKDQSAEVPVASQAVVGGAKIWLTGTTLNISTTK